MAKMNIFIDNLEWIFYVESSCSL